LIVTQEKPGRPNPEQDEETIRAAIDGRVAFATAVFLVGAGAFILLDRIGAPERLVASLGPALAAAGLATIGFMLRSMRISGFHGAGRMTPGVYAGMAMAALAAALATPFAWSLPASASLSSLLIGFGAGLALAALVTGPMLRKAGAFSIADLIATRFPSLTLRVGVTLAIGALGFSLGLAGLAMAQSAIAQATSLGLETSAILAACVVAVIVVPGGMAGLVWSATGAAGLLIAGIAAPLALLIASGATIPLPGDGAAFEQALTRLSEWRGAASAPAEADGLLIAALALGLGALPPLLAPLLTTPRKAEAGSGGVTGLLWCGLLTLMALVVVAASTLALQAGVTGLRLVDLPPFLLAASGRGLVAICGANPLTIAQAREACAAMPGFAETLRPSDIAASAEYLVLGLPELRGYGAAFSGLAMAGRMAIALALCAAGFLSLATAIGDSAFYQANKAYRLASRRLAARRLLLLGAIGGGAWVVTHMVTDARLLVVVALWLSAVTVTPLLALCLWPRAEGHDGAIALVAGLAMAEAILLLSGHEPTIEVLASAAVVGCVTAIAAGVGASFLHPADPTSEGAAFVHGLLDGQGDVLRPDKGA